MRALIQRVSRASVSVDGKPEGTIEQGLVVLLGIAHADTSEDITYLVNKTIDLRIFSDAERKMNLSLRDVAGEVLIVSQFTLYGDVRRGRRPSYTDAARPETAIPLYESFVQAFRSQGIPVKTGEFGADMAIDLCNDGPVTLMLESSVANS